MKIYKQLFITLAAITLHGGINAMIGSIRAEAIVGTYNIINKTDKALLLYFKHKNPRNDTYQIIQPNQEIKKDLNVDIELDYIPRFPEFTESDLSYFDKTTGMIIQGKQRDFEDKVRNKFLSSGFPFKNCTPEGKANDIIITDTGELNYNKTPKLIATVNDPIKCRDIIKK